jgi:transglutaminase-like putative cysteine protease
VSSIERFFQFSLLGLVTSAFCALADTGRLDLASLGFLLAGVVWRGLIVAGVVRFQIPQRLITTLATAYVLFYPIDYYFVSRDFFAATAHGVCFLGVARILSARSNRDYLYTGSLAFVALIGAAVLSTQLRFFLWLALAILFSLGVLTSAEIRRGFQRDQRARANARTGWMLGVLVGCAACGILVLTAGLFLIVPRTARAAATLWPNHRYSGFTNSIDLGHFGPVTKDDRPVLHIHSYGAPLPPSLKWRGAALSIFNGHHWAEPSLPGLMVKAQGTTTVADLSQLSRRDAARMVYRVDVASSDSGSIFIAGVPEFINLTMTSTESPTLVRTAEDAFRALPAMGEPLSYEVSAEESAPLPYPLSTSDRSRNLRLPANLDKRIIQLGQAWTGNATTDAEMAARIQDRLHHDFVYALDGATPARSRDPLADFLFVTKRGYCEYFASAMAVLLRTQGVPARVATGFQSGYFNDVSNTWVVRASDAHAWVEAWIEGRGWVTYDPTPPATEDASGGWLERRLQRINMYLDAADTTWQRWVLAYNPGQQAALAFAFRDKLRAAGNGGTTFSMPNLFAAGWRSWLFLLVTIATAAFGAKFGPGLWRRWIAGSRMRKLMRKIHSGGGTASDARLLYERMLESVEKRGFQKPAWFTPTEFARNLPAKERERVGAFTEAYNEIRFGNDPGGVARLAAMLETMEALS